MKLEHRRRLMLLALSLVACWPVGHYVLVDRYLVNPWELGGFAMYVQPNQPIEVKLRMPGGEFVECEQLGAACHAYRQQAQTLGLLANAEMLIVALRRAGWAYDHVEIELRRSMLVPSGELVVRAARRRISMQ